MARGKLKKVRTCVKTLRNTELYDLKHKFDKMLPQDKTQFINEFGAAKNSTLQRLVEDKRRQLI